MSWILQFQSESSGAAEKMAESLVLEEEHSHACSERAT